MNITAWILFGMITGVVAHMFEPDKNNFLSTVVMAVLGALAGGFLASVIFGVGVINFDLPSTVVAIVGSLLLLFILKSLKEV